MTQRTLAQEIDQAVRVIAWRRKLDPPAKVSIDEVVAQVKEQLPNNSISRDVRQFCKDNPDLLRAPFRIKH